MYEGRTVFAQLMDHLPRHTFRRLVKRYSGAHRVKNFTCWDQFLCMAFAQLTYRDSLRDIEACLGAVPEKLYHLGFRARAVARSTLADANENRDWRMFADFAQVLIYEARRLYVDEPLSLELDQTVYALASTTIDLCPSVFPWARFRSTKAGIKLHTLLDLQGNIPVFIWITDAKHADVRILDVLVPEPGSIYLFDRAYVDFHRLHRLTEAHAVFVTRAKKNLQWRRLYSRPVDRATGLVCDQTIVLTGVDSARAYPEHLRRVRFRDPETGKRLTFLTNDFALPPLTIARLYRYRWQVELFFKCARLKMVSVVTGRGSSMLVTPRARIWSWPSLMTPNTAPGIWCSCMRSSTSRTSSSKRLSARAARASGGRSLGAGPVSRVFTMARRELGRAIPRASRFRRSMTCLLGERRGPRPAGASHALDAAYRGFATLEDHQARSRASRLQSPTRTASPASPDRLTDFGRPTAPRARSPAPGGRPIFSIAR